GKTPTNLREGIFPVSQRGVLDRVQVADGEKWKNFKNSSRDSLPVQVSTAAPPARMIRTIGGGGSAAGVAVTPSRRESGIVFDPAQRRFITSGSPSSTERVGAETPTSGATSDRQAASASRPTGAKTSDLRRGSETPGARRTAPANSRNSLPPSARNSVAPPVPRQSSSGERTGGAGGSGGNSRGGGS